MKIKYNFTDNFKITIIYFKMLCKSLSFLDLPAAKRGFAPCPHNLFKKIDQK